MKYRILLVAASVGLLAGCPDDDDDNNATNSTTQSYTVSVTNLTPNQHVSAGGLDSQ
ncbi:hypothetical protein JCM19231_5139 [Vibrio ishigakensis]|uniref:Uncharacterized protein n=1 Tax=Vibrio ishigakensis TaxID=1481914 RepID=A0A0B8NSJ8_9VIBR|nr:hypothetical protein JCM19231_5139 [Vibrio ishigakensis]GAM68042.1 hypothetical protein JCM19236_2197 [Vibrio sp. JCM 19236]